MKKFVRKRKTFEDGAAQTRPGELYILDVENGGAADKGGGGLVRQLPSTLIARLRTDLEFAATINRGTAKANSRLKEEMAVVTRDAYVSKSAARERLGQVIKQKIARGHESIHFFKHKLEQQKVASLNATKVRIRDENLTLKTRVERRNQELRIQTTALEALGEISKLDEHMLRQKDNEIDDLKDVIDKLNQDLLHEKRKTTVLIEGQKDTQFELLRAYSTLGSMALETGKASHKASVYELNDVEEMEETQGHVMGQGSTSEEEEEEKEEDNQKEEDEDEDEDEDEAATKEKIWLTPETKSRTTSKTTSKTTNSTSRTTRRTHRHQRPKSALPSQRKRKTTPNTTNPKTTRFHTPLSSKSSKRRQRPSSAAHRSPSAFASITSSSPMSSSPITTASRKKKKKLKKLHPYLERGQRHGPGWKSTLSSPSALSSTVNSFVPTPISHQNASIFPKTKFLEQKNITLYRKSNGKRMLKIRAGFNDCYSDEHVAELLSNTMSLPNELQPTSHWPPPSKKGWQMLLKEETNRLNSVHKENRKHRYLRWYPTIGRGQANPTTLSPSPLRAMAEAEHGPSDPRQRPYTAPRRRSSVDAMGDWLEKSRDRTSEREGTGLTGETEEGMQEGPNLNRAQSSVANAPKNKHELELLEAREKEDIPTLYAINKQNQDYPNVNAKNLFRFHEKLGKYIHQPSQLEESQSAMARRQRNEEMMKKKEEEERNQRMLKHRNQLNRAEPVSRDPKIKRSPNRRTKKRPKSAKLSRRKSDALLNRLMNTTGSKFAGPGYRKGDRTVVKTSGSAKYQMQKMRDKIKKKARENERDKD